MKWVLVCSLALLLIIAACSSQESTEQVSPPIREPLPSQEEAFSCTQDSDCVPLPSQCHPTHCINKEYVDSFQKPEACTTVFVTDAAYSADDCGCQANTCVNLNQGKTIEEVDGVDIERYYCEPTYDSDCDQQYIPVCDFDADGNQVDTFSNACVACNDVEVSSWTLDEC